MPLLKLGAVKKGALRLQLVARCRDKIASVSLCLIYRWQNEPRNTTLRSSLVDKIDQLRLQP